MAQIIETLIVPDPAAGSAQAGALLAQLRATHEALRESSRAADDSSLHWQPAPGTNSIAMILAHIAVSEVHLGQVGILAEKQGHPQDVIGIGVPETGMPQADDGAPPAALAGKPLAWFDDLLAKAFAHTERIALGLGDADLDRRIERPQPNGNLRVFNPRWTMHHLIEHLAGHTGQVELILHLYRKRSSIR
jgi:uncharacterized damage-inducible protein DinB